MLILILMYVLILPAKLGWNFEVNVWQWNIFPTIMHLIDIILTLNTAFFSEGFIIKDR